MNAPQPSTETGPGAHFGSTFAPASSSSTSPSTHKRASSNPYRNATPPSKTGASATVRGSTGSPKERFPDYRADAFSSMDPSQDSRRRAGSHGTPPSYREATSGSNTPGGTGRRRGSSLRERYPGDESHKPLDIIRRDSRKASRSPHLKKKSIPGADQIDRLDPAIGGRAYHHEGPYDAALLSRNRDPKNAPINALDESNREALKATPAENVKNAIERHQPLDGVADVPPGRRDRMGRTYNYEEGTDLMREGYQSEPGYKQWPGKASYLHSHFRAIHIPANTQTELRPGRPQRRRGADLFSRPRSPRTQYRRLPQRQPRHRAPGPRTPDERLRQGRA